MISRTPAAPVARVDSVVLVSGSENSFPDATSGRRGGGAGKDDAIAWAGEQDKVRSLCLDTLGSEGQLLVETPSLRRRRKDWSEGPRGA